MPNWCVNQVDVEGDEAEIAKLIAFAKSSESDFDFAKIVPPPDSKFYPVGEGQNDFQCGCKKEFIITKPAEGEPFTEGFVPHEGYWVVNGVKVEKQQSESSSIEGVVSDMFGGAEICPIHKVEAIRNHPDWWYNWNVANWGTKWSAGEIWHDRADDSTSKVDGKTSYNFDTAWSPSEPVVAALAEKFPTLRIEHRYCEGGMGYAGEVIYEGGSEIYRQEYDQSEMPDGAFTDEWERDYSKIPQTPFEHFAEEHFGGVVGG